MLVDVGIVEFSKVRGPNRGMKGVKEQMGLEFVAFCSRVGSRGKFGGDEGAPFVLKDSEIIGPALVEGGEVFIGTLFRNGAKQRRGSTVGVLGGLGGESAGLDFVKKGNNVVLVFDRLKVRISKEAVLHRESTLILDHNKNL